MQTLAGAEDALFQHWEVPGKPMAVYLSRAVSATILRSAGRGLLRRRPEVGGLLLGTVTVQETITIRIEDCVDLPCDHLFGPSYTLSEGEKETLRRAVVEHGAGFETEMCVVGFYRTHTRRGLALDSDDLQLSDSFPEGADLALLVKPRPLRAPQAAFFFWDDALTAPQSPAIEFNIPRHGPRDFATPEPPKAPRRPFWSSWWLQAPLGAFLLVAWYLVGFAAGRQIDKAIPRAAPPPRDPYALSLLVLQYGDNLHLSWDRQARPIVAAERGSLLISDAGQNRTLDLTREQLRNGAVAYHQLSEHVQLRLEVFLPGRRSVSESWETSTGGR
jgi:hypothetical protein